MPASRPAGRRPPNVFEMLGSYELDGDRLRFTMPSLANDGAFTGAPKLESTAANKQILFTWRRAKPAVAPPAGPKR